MSVHWRVAALLLAATLIYLVAVPATHVTPSLAPARAQLLAGDVPLWNGAPLLANPYLGLAHPFTLLAILANSAVVATALRLLAMLVFSFILFRGWDVGEASALFGAIAFTFCTTHLLSWSALTLAALPLALAAGQAHVRRPRASTFAALTVALALAILGGHETALRVALVTAAWLVFLAMWRPRELPVPRLRILLTAAVAIAFAFGLTAFYWMAVEDIAPHIARAEVPSGPLRFLALLAPNVLGTTGEGYAGILTLLLGVLGLIASERREKWFFAVIGLIAFWPLGLAALATLGLCAVTRGNVTQRTFRIVAGCLAFALLTVWFARAEYVSESFAWTQALIPFVALGLFTFAVSERRIFPAVVAAVLTFTELTLVAQQAKPQLPQLMNDRYARLNAELPDVLARTPPVFAVQRYGVQAEIPDVIPRLKRIPDVRSEAIVHDVPPSIVEQSPQLAQGSVSAPRNVHVHAVRAREREYDVAAANGWSVIVTHEVDWPGWRGYWNGRRCPVVTVDGAFAGAFVPPEKGTLLLRYWPPAFVDGLRVSVISLLLFGVAVFVVGRMKGR